MKRFLSRVNVPFSTNMNAKQTSSILKSAVSLLVIFAIVLSLTPYVLAAETGSSEAADALHELGLFQGVSTNADGTPFYDLDRAPTRQEAVTMLVRLLGKEDEAKSGRWNIPFSDVDGWAVPYVGYAYSNGLTEGTGANTFGGQNPVSATQYLTLGLRALGYQSGTDFQWDKAWELTDKLGITYGQYDASSAFTRGDVAAISYRLLYTPLKNEPRSTLLFSLKIKQGQNAEIFKPLTGDWASVSDFNGSAKFSIDNKTLVVENEIPDAASLLQAIPVKTNTDYRLSAMVRVDGYSCGEQFPGGASIGIEEMPLLNDYTKSSQWSKSEVVFNTGEMTSVTLRVSNGGYAADVAGTAYFRDISLEDLSMKAEGRNDAAQYQTTIKRGQYLLAISTADSESVDAPGSFTLTKAGEYTGKAPVPLRTGAKESRTIPTPDNGMTMGTVPLLSYSPGNDLYHIGEQITIAEEGRLAVTGSIYAEMECLAIGTYCTVWACVTDSASLKLTKELALQLAAEYDEAMPALLDVYGGWLDVDGDGRVALLCSGLDEKKGILGGGYTDFKNLYDKDGKIVIDGYSFGQHSPPDAEALPYLLGMDCVHIGTEGLLSDRLLSVALHETAHLIDYSYCVSCNGNYSAPFNLLTEAIAETAPSQIDSLNYLENVSVDWLNRPENDTGRGMLVSDEIYVYYGELNLFLQYLRTRYAQMNGSGDGLEFYRLLMRAQLKTQGSLLEVIAEEIFGVTKVQLLEDFWMAVFLNEKTGRYGFNGETWADGMKPNCLVNGSTEKIMNGGARCYYISDGDYVVSDSENLTFIVLDRLG